jgi:hypothetical protein
MLTCMDLVKIKEALKVISDGDVWSLYAHLSTLLKERGLVRTRNIIGERGEFLAIETYNKTSGLPKLQAAPEGTQNIDAISRKGDRYSIKTISAPGVTTGVFYGFEEPGAPQADKKFEYIIIVVVDGNLDLLKMLELTYEQFLKFRKWHKTMRAWNLSLTRQLCAEAKLIASSPAIN